MLLSAPGYPLDQAAEVLRIDRDAVSRTLDRWEQGGLAALAEGARPGRPPKGDAATTAEGLHAAQKSPASPRRVLAKKGRCWQPPGPTLAVPAQAHGQRWNVGGFLRGDGELAHLGRAGRLGAGEFIEAVETRLWPVLRRPGILVLDNGPCHRRKLVKARRAEWRQRGLRRFFWPPYCPHLHRIETLWRLVKHHWLAPAADATFATLRAHVTAILNVAGLDYRVSFS